MTAKFIRLASAQIIVGLSATIASPVWSTSHQAGINVHGEHGKHAGQPGTRVPANDLTDAEVRKIDKEGGKLTLKHAEIKSLDMPPMTMVFGVKDRAMLDALKVGDKIKFRAISDAGKFTVTEIQIAP